MKKQRAYRGKQTWWWNLYGCFRLSASFKSVIDLGGTPDNGLYGEALPERGFRLRAYKRVGISLIEVYQRGGKSDISVCKRPNGARGSYILWLRKNLENVLVSWFIHILKTVIYSSCKGCNFLNVVSERGTICPIQIYKRETFSVQK